MGDLEKPVLSFNYYTEILCFCMKTDDTKSGC